MELRTPLAEINLNALSHNLSIAKNKTAKNEILAVVKADAYGHGAVKISKHLSENGISKLGVAFASEAIILREAGINADIHIFFDRDNIEACLKYNLIPTVFDLKTAKRISDAAYRENRNIPVHIKVDTGMGRIGLNVNDAHKEIAEIASLKNIEPEGLMSHFSDADLQDKEFATLQLNKFNSLTDDLGQIGIKFKYLHIANSAAVLTMPDAHLDMVRPGIMLYGYSYPSSDDLRPVMTLKSGILMLKRVPPGTPISYGRTFVTKRESVIATIPIGYGDGYSRMLSNNGEVLVSEQRAPVIGRVCMDTFMIDVTDIPDVSYESEVVIIGKQGEEKITATDIADRTGTISYEVLTSIGKRVPRVYI